MLIILPPLLCWHILQVLTEMIFLESEKKKQPGLKLWHVA